MYKARYYNTDGEKGGARALPDTLFDGVVNEGVLHQVVKAYQANARAGTGSAKNRSAVRGGGRKPWRQKGTGRARAGSIRSPIWAGGGQAFPPVPHSWRQRIPKKLKGLARRSAWNSRAEDDRIILVDSLEFEEPGTRRLVNYLEEIEVQGRTLLLTDGLKQTVYLSGRNVPWLEIMPFGQENALDLLMAETVVIEESAVAKAQAEADKEESEAGEPKASPEAVKTAVEEEAPAEAPEVEEEEAPEAEAAEPEWPKKGGGGWYELSDGSKVQGEEKARKAQAALDAAGDDDSDDEEKE